VYSSSLQVSLFGIHAMLSIQFSCRNNSIQLENIVDKMLLLFLNQLAILKLLANGNFRTCLYFAFASPRPKAPYSSPWDYRRKEWLVR